MKKLFVFSILALGFSSQAFATFKSFYGCYDTVSIDGEPFETPAGMNGKSSIKVNPYGSFYDENWQSLKSVDVEAFFIETWTEEDGSSYSQELYAVAEEILPGGVFTTQDGAQCHNFNGDVLKPSTMMRPEKTH